MLTAIISISRGSYSKGKEIAEKVAQELGYECVARDVLLEASEEFNVPRIKLIRAIHDAPSILDRFSYGKEKYTTFIQAEILEHFRKDNVVYHGLAGHFFVEDDGMLFQGIDYYDFVASNIEGFARGYKDKKIDPSQKVRLFLIAPSFSIQLLNRCKWVDIPIFLFTFQCIAFEDKPKEIIPVYKELTIPSVPEIVEVYTIEENLSYITDKQVRDRA